MSARRIPEPVPARRMLVPAAGFVIWSSAFVLLYAALSIGCRFGWDRWELGIGLTVQRAVQVVLLFAHLAAGAWLVHWSARRDRAAAAEQTPPARFLGRVGYMVSVAALASTAFSFFAVFAVTACY